MPFQLFIAICSNFFSVPNQYPAALKLLKIIEIQSVENNLTFKNTR